jgi:dTDP-glucose 4,6-dehydratase
MTFRKILVTGGAGFIGSNFIRWLLPQEPDVVIINLDALTYAGHLSNLENLPDPDRHIFVQGDIAEEPIVRELFARHSFDAVVHFAAESHVDRSILGAHPFLRANVLGTQTLLEAARATGVSRFVSVSTDEVYGSLGPTGLFTEETPLAPNSPYSASKAAADLLARAAFHTFQQPVVITRCSNNYGPHQLPEKLIPLMITNALRDKKLPVYGDGLNVRDWIYVDDHCRGVWAALTQGQPGEVYNLGGASECPNLQVVRQILALLGKPDSLLHYVTDRKGHDRRYAIDFSKAQKELGWQPTVRFDAGLKKTVSWYQANPQWWEPLLPQATL